MIDVYQPPRQKPPRGQRKQGAGLQRVLFVLIALCLVGITIVALVLAREYLGNTRPEPQPTLTPVATLIPTHTLAPTSTPTLAPTPLSPTPSPTSTPAPTPTSTPTPEPTLPPGVLSFPLYSGNPRLPEIALTFDDGPNPTYTAQILAVLQQYDVSATFFAIGSEAAAHPALVQQESQQGYIVGNHTWSHPNLINLSPAEIRTQLLSASNEIEADTDQTPTLMRPPGGNFNSEVQSIAASLGLSTILWNVDPRDWSRPGINKIIQTVLDTTHNGSIILLHDGGGDRSQTVAAISEATNAAPGSNSVGMFFSVACSEMTLTPQSMPTAVQMVEPEMRHYFLTALQSAYGELAAQTLSRSYFFLFPGTGHGVVGRNYCANSMFRAFLEQPAEKPDATFMSAVQEPFFE